MSISHVSNISIYNNMRTTVQRARSELVQREQEAVTGRHSDVNLALGHKAGVPAALRVEVDRLQSIVSENALVTKKLDVTQDALGNLASANQLVVDALVAAIGSQGSVAVAIELTRTVLAQFTATMNTSDGGQYLFAGINTDAYPFDDFLAEPAGSSKTAFETAFTVTFGFAPGDPAAASIDPASMGAFLDGVFEQLFEDPQWQANWSAASDRNIRSRIAPQMVVETGVNANEGAFRTLAKAYVMVVGLGVESLNDQSRQVVLERALAASSEGVGEVNGIRMKAGVVQQQVEVQSEAIGLRIQINTRYLTALEGVDQYEAVTRLNELTKQMEASYALTSRLQSLSLLNYV